MKFPPLMAIAALALAACASAPATISGNVMRFSGKVEAIDNGCFADGVCSVTVAGTTIVTMVGWSQDTWGNRPAELKTGDPVEVRCRRSDAGCTLNGSADYYIRNKP